MRISFHIDGNMRYRLAHVICLEGISPYERGEILTGAIHESYKIMPPGSMITLTYIKHPNSIVIWMENILNMNPDRLRSLEVQIHKDFGPQMIGTQRAKELLELFKKTGSDEDVMQGIVECIYQFMTVLSLDENQRMFNQTLFPKLLKRAGFKNVKLIYSDGGLNYIAIKDWAMGVTTDMSKGGIDLTTANNVLQAQNNGGAIKFHIDPAMLKQLQNAPGFVPVIINIQPLNNLQQFLGIDADR